MSVWQRQPQEACVAHGPRGRGAPRLRQGFGGQVGAGQGPPGGLNTGIIHVVRGRRVLAALLLLCGVAAVAQDQKAFAVEPLAPDPARDARVEELIGKLIEIAPWHGIGASAGDGDAVDALEVRNTVPDALRVRSDPPGAFRDLVRLGPAAIPALLKHLDDKRETKLSFHWSENDGMGGMFEQPELFAGSSAERALIVRTLGTKGVKNPAWDEPPSDLLDTTIRDHAVTVGDCCFVILGQIVHRSYEAVRYEPSGVTIVSSPHA